MNGLRRHIVAVLLSAGLLVACGKKEPPPPPPPTVVSLTLKASPDVNPDATGAAKPVRVKILQLASSRAFLESDFFALDRNLDKTLGKDLKGMEEIVVPPGGTQVWQAKLPDDVKVIGVMGAYHAIDKAQWRASKEVPKNATTLLQAEFDAKGVKLGAASP